MKISKSMFYRICLIAGLIFSAQFSFAGTDPIPVPIPPDGSPEPGKIQPASVTFVSASATINDTELAVYFDYSVGDATITVYDASNNIVYQETVDTDVSSAVNIVVSSWLTGDYMMTVTYGTTTQRGYFSLE